jgi:hypothetical protein
MKLQYFLRFLFLSRLFVRGFLGAIMDDSNNNYEVFRDCVSATVLAKSATKPSKPPKKRVARVAREPATSPQWLKVREEALSSASPKDDDAAELAEFIEVVSTAMSSSHRM